MNREEIIKMAREAGIGWAGALGGMDDFLEHFAALVAAHEREECAKVCEGRIGVAVQANEWWIGFKSAMKQCAAAIRAREVK